MGARVANWSHNRCEPCVNTCILLLQHLRHASASICSCSCFRTAEGRISRMLEDELSGSDDDVSGSATPTDFRPASRLLNSSMERFSDVDVAPSDSDDDDVMSRTSRADQNDVMLLH